MAPAAGRPVMTDTPVTRPQPAIPSPTAVLSTYTPPAQASAPVYTATPSPSPFLAPVTPTPTSANPVSPKATPAPEQPKEAPRTSMQVPASTVTVSPSPTPLPAPAGPASPSPTVVPPPVPTPTVAHPTKTPVPTSTATIGPLSGLAVRGAFPGLSMRRMTAMAFPDKEGDRLFVALQAGLVVSFSERADASDTENFLDVRDRVDDRGNEEGLLGLAFDPSYSENGYFYVYYTASGPKRSVLSRFAADLLGRGEADTSSEVVILEVPQPFRNHNGGQIAFGPDGFLYVGLGDGGSSGDPAGNGQNTAALLGSILRIDVAGLDVVGSYTVPRDNPFVGQGSGVREEIWAYGLRNPWRFSFDSLTGDLWAADVGQNRFEEVDLIMPGRNYGWNVTEGRECFSPSRGCDAAGLEPPVAVYSHDEGCSVTGGYVYRGDSLSSLYGAYVYGDFCSGKIWALRYDGALVREHMEIADTDLSISSFGLGRDGEIYILSFDGKIYRFAKP